MERVLIGSPYAIKSAYGREYCTALPSTTMKSMASVKELQLAVLKRDPNHVIMIEDQINSFILDLDNGIPVCPYQGPIL